MSRVIRSPRSRLDLLEIGQHISQENPAAADRMLLRIDEKLQLLAENPLMGESRPELPGNVRSVSVGMYVILFRPLEDGIQLVRVVHGARDIDSLF
jgi:toxin ParE1/3/4